MEGGHIKRNCHNQPAAAAGQQQQQPARGGGGGRGRGRGRGGPRPHDNPAPVAEPINQIHPMHQRFTGNQAVNSVNQQPEYRPHHPRQYHQQPHRGRRYQNNKSNKQRKNGTKPFKLTREMLEIERVERELRQLVSFVWTMVGDLNTVVNWAGDQFSLRPIMQYPPPIGQVSQVAQGGQMCVGGGAANDSRNLHVPHHHHCRASDEREVSRVDNNDALYFSNKDSQMSLNGERGRGQWGVTHDAPHTPIRAVHDARDAPPDPYDDESESYDDEHEGEGHDDSDNCGHEYDRQVRSDEPRRGPAGGRLTHSPHTISRLGSEREEAVECPEDPPNPPLTHLPEYMVGRNLLDSGDPEDRPNPPLTHLPEYMVGTNLLNSGDPDDRPNPPLTPVPEPLSASLSGAGEGTRANLDDDIHNNRILRQV